jgi:NAD(P) transhydrogenase
LGLETLVKIGRGKFIETDEFGYTGTGQIYAAGDVAGANLATLGQANATRVVRKCFGSGHVHTDNLIEEKPLGVWTLPEIAWVGMTEAKANLTGDPIGTATVGYKESLRGCITNDFGFLKLVYNRETGRVLGCHIFGQDACDLIAYGSDCVNAGYTIFDILKFVFPAVTHHQLYQLAAMSAKKNMLKIGATYDFVVLGAGPAGIQAAVDAAGRGRKVAIIDPKPVVTGAPTGAHSKCLREAALLG